MNKIKITERFNPEKYGMAFCPSCSGSGRSLANAQGINVCTVCGGFGLIKRGDESRFQFGRVDSSVNRAV